jgi:dTMP kinase
MCNAKSIGVELVKQKGVFLCVEGLDGCGKTTQAKLLVAKLGKSHNAIYTAEPSCGKIGTFIRENCLYGKRRLSSAVEALLFAADRADHVEHEILPALNDGKVVVCDRYVYSSLAYQGATGLSLDWIERINAHALLPDFAIFLDVNPETAMQRLKPKRSVMENLETQQKVREIYLKFVGKGELSIVDGNKPKEKVAEALFTAVLRFLATLKEH